MIALPFFPLCLGFIGKAGWMDGPGLDDPAKSAAVLQN